MTNAAGDAVFRALADPVRRDLLDALHAQNGQTLAALGSGKSISRQAISKHLALLEAARLVITRRRGREKLHFLNAAPIHEIGEHWLSKFAPL